MKIRESLNGENRCTMARLKSLACAVGVFVVGGMLTGFAPADADTDNAAEAVAAIQNVAPEVVAASAETNVVTDTETAAVADTEAGIVVVPSEATDGIRLGEGNTSSLLIGLPFAVNADDAAESDVPGVIVYDNNNGSSTVPVIRENGIQITTVIDGADAPTRFDYALELPIGQSLSLNADGSISLVAADGSLAGGIDAPWAKDANGRVVPTHYELRGSTVTQVIEFTSQTAFPVIADPTYTTYVITYSRADVEQMWKMINNVNNICRYVPLPYLGSVACSAPAALSSAVTQAHYQSKRVKATYRYCGYSYCSYYTYAVVS